MPASKGSKKDQLNQPLWRLPHRWRILNGISRQIRNVKFAVITQQGRYYRKKMID